MITVVVSIPFIAGQWSLRHPPRRPGGPAPCFNPLHCGAVVASGAASSTGRRRRRVSIPFIAGQWSLRARRMASVGRRAVSIPFIAGQWSLRAGGARRRGGAGPGFNPLHCGAVVASRGGARGDGPPAVFQSPSLRGSGRFPGASRETQQPDRKFQSPSLRGSGRFGRLNNQIETLARLVSIPFIAGQWSLPPRDTMSRGDPRPVSIPFIAGQWSLLPGARALPRAACRFQSPSLRGSGRFVRPGRAGARRDDGFNPLHCGAVVASQDQIRQRIQKAQGFQSPSLRGSGRFKRLGNQLEALARKFQSPSLRGSGRFERGARRCLILSVMFQSPSLRGSGRFAHPPGGGGARGPRFNPLHCGAVVASWRLVICDEQRFMRFNPLHCGAVVASMGPPLPYGRGAHVSIPFIAGQWSLLGERASKSSVRSTFQSPSLRGSGRFMSP